MARPQLRARFFASSDGRVCEKARPLTPRQRASIFARDRERCRYCDARVTWLRMDSQSLLSDTVPGAVDHVFPRARGGQNDPANLVLACEPCNAQKGAD